MEAGTGKTLAAIDLIRCVGDLSICIWFTPCQTKINLDKEIEKHGGLPCQLEIIGIETMSASDREYLRVLALVEANPNSFVVVDESLKIKNWDAKRTQRITHIGQLAGYRIVLNGTPVTRDLLDLWAQVNFLSPKILNMSLAQFKATYCETVTRTTYGHQRIKREEWIVAYHNLEHLYSRINRYVYGCDLQLELKKHHHEVICDLSDEAEETYQAIKERYLKLETMDRLNGNIFLMMVQQLQQTYSLLPSKIVAVRDIVERHGPALIFCKYVATADALRNILPRECSVLTYGKHSFGLNMQHHHVTVFVDQTWDYAQRIQAEARTYRTGQTHDCLYFSLMTNAKLDGVMRANQSKKGGLLARLKEIGSAKFMEEI
jgi:hypothetical protein